MKKIELYRSWRNFFETLDLSKAGVHQGNETFVKKMYPQDFLDTFGIPYKKLYHGDTLEFYHLYETALNNECNVENVDPTDPIYVVYIDGKPLNKIYFTKEEMTEAIQKTNYIP